MEPNEAVPGCPWHWEGPGLPMSTAQSALEPSARYKSISSGGQSPESYFHGNMGLFSFSSCFISKGFLYYFPIPISGHFTSPESGPEFSGNSSLGNSVSVSLMEESGECRSSNKKV